MAFYNAVIVSPYQRKTILGRTLLTNYDALPSEWKIIHHSGRRIYSGHDFDKTLADPIKPMIITCWPQKPARPGIDTFEIFVKNLRGETLTLEVDHFKSITDVKQMIFHTDKTPIDQQRLIWVGKQLEDNKILLDYMIGRWSTFHLVLRLRGGAAGPSLSLSVHDLEGQCVTGVGREVKPEPEGDWKSFSRGLNVIGRCGDSSCKSTKHKQDKAIIKYGYSTVTQRPFTGTRCPACKGGGFKPSNFLLSGAKADFRFRKTGEHEVKSVIVESGKFPEYKMFSESEEKVDYDFIKITAVPLNGSLCHCAVCSNAIGGGDQELKMACGHIFHQWCHDLGKDCEVCQAQFIFESALENFRRVEI